MAAHCTQNTSQTPCSGLDSPMWSGPWVPPKLKLLPGSCAAGTWASLSPLHPITTSPKCLVSFFTGIDGWYSYKSMQKKIQECCCSYAPVCICLLCKLSLKSPSFLPAKNQISTCRLLLFRILWPRLLMTLPYFIECKTLSTVKMPYYFM